MDGLMAWWLDGRRWTPTNITLKWCRKQRKILKLSALVIYGQLTDLSNLSIKSLEFPDDWKWSKVFPLFKAGERKNPNNYRPISVLSTVSRVFEKLQ